MSAINPVNAIKRPPDDSNSNSSSPINSHIDGGAGLCPPLKKKKLVIEPLRIGPVSTLEEMDIKVIQFQQKKMRQRLEARHRQEEEMKVRIEQLETRQTQDDAVLNVINRYWNQLNEDIRILLQRFDAETSDESESKNESEATTSFLTQLSTWDKEELDTKLVNRVQVSTRAVAKIIQAFDRLQQRSEKISTKLIKGDVAAGPDKLPKLEETLKEASIQLERENRQLQALNISLHERYHIMSLKIKELSDKLSSEVTKGDELKNRVDDLSYEVSKLISHNDKLITHIQELAEKYSKLQQSCGSEDKKECDFKVDMSDMEVVVLQKDNEELRELANNRLTELDNLQHNHKETLKELEKLRVEIRHLPDVVLMETTEYKCLQSKFSVMYYESNQLRNAFVESRSRQSARQAAFASELKANEQMESEELMVQKQLRTEMVQLEDTLSQTRKEYEMLRIEFEQNLTANEQTGPINREMRHLITSLQTHNQQLKGDSQRYRRKYKEIGNEMGKLKRERDHMEAKLNILLEKDNLRRRNNSDPDSFLNEDSPTASFCYIKSEVFSPSDVKMNHEGESSNDGMDNFKNDKLNNDIHVKKEVKQEKKSPRSECDTMKDLRSQLKKALNEQRETKLLLDMYQGSSKDQRERVQLMASEKKCRLEIEELRLTVKKIQEFKKEDKKKLADEDCVRKLRMLEEQVHNLQKQVTAQKLEEETLINEMEVTGQAFEDIQESNSRLIQQLREKDDANFKLMSDRIRNTQLQKLAQEEKELLIDQLNAFTRQLESQNMVLRKLDDKEKLVVHTIISTLDKETEKRTLASECYKRKAIESAQSAADLKLHLEKYHSQTKDAQHTMTEKTGSLEAEAYKANRLQEEITKLRRKVERLSKVEMAGSSDEVMMEEIREYKETLTCPSCKVKRKDAVLTKCFHVFCFDCLRTRYETRQRKCPKCNAAFGANDYHRLYLT